MSAQKGKEVIYIDVDDEITAIIDKVRSSHERIVALVLPKRATVFQSIVNMKLLKRTADTAKKHLVLITSEPGLLPLAGAVGVHVAKSLQSKPEIPGVHGQDAGGDDEEAADMSSEPAEGAGLDASKPVGEYVKAAAPSVASPLDAEDDLPIELDNAAPAAADAIRKSDKKNRKLKIPNFNKFRLLTALSAVGLVLILVLWYAGFVVMPKATVAVKTDSSAIDVNLDVTFKTDAQEVDVEAAVIPAKAQQTQKTASQQADATGQVDKGTKATGEVVLRNCTDNPVNVPVGTGVSANGLTFITQQPASMDSGNFSGNGTCKSSGSHVRPVDVIAQNVGDKYNIDSTSFTVAGSSGVTGTGSQMTGGTSNIVKVVAQADIDTAKQKISSQNTDAIKAELLNALKAQGMYAIDGSFSAGAAEASTDVQAGTEAATVTVTQKTTYTMLGVKQDDLKKLIANEANKEIDPQKQSILDYGLDAAVFRLQNQQGTDTLSTLEATVIAGSDLDIAEIKRQIAGKKANDAKEIIGDYPGVSEVTVDYSPFWVSAIPKKTSKITVNVEVPSVKDAR